MSYTLEDLKGPQYALLQNGERADARIDQVQFLDNEKRKGRKDLRVTLVLTNGPQEGKVINHKIYDGSKLYDFLRVPVNNDDNKLLNMLNHSEGLSRLIGMRVTVTGDVPRTKNNVSYTKVSDIQWF